MWVPLGEGVAAGSINGFWDAVNIWINKPHVVNRRLCGSCLLLHQKLNTMLDLTACVTLAKQNWKRFSESDSCEETLAEIFPAEATEKEDSPNSGEHHDTSSCLDAYVRDLHPKVLYKYSTQRELILQDKTSGTIVFIPLVVIQQRPVVITSSLQTSYKLQYDSHLHSMGIAVLKEVGDKVEQTAGASDKLVCPTQSDTGSTLKEENIGLRQTSTSPSFECEKCEHIDFLYTAGKQARKRTHESISDDGASDNNPQRGPQDFLTMDLSQGSDAAMQETQMTVRQVAAKTQNVLFTPVSGADCTEEWLQQQLLPKLAQWSFQDNLNTNVTSLRLVPLDRYNQRYNAMKSKYGPNLVQNWPECTDPQKFVYEDIAIAAYLLTLWDSEREEGDPKDNTKKQTFVDLGCGNGLLVHLLTLEGHSGKGIDLRKRSIWDFYGTDTSLEEYPLTPSDKHLFAGYDWLIGNHSDELTPWIAVIASRSSYKCRYFVLPCCPYDFNSKFREKQHGKSQYRCYLDFVRLVGEKCGFTVDEDTMRIPSTKRVCFVGRSRTYPEAKEEEAETRRTAFIASRCQPVALAPTTAAQSTSEDGSTAWAANFKARSSKEVVRNCVLIDKDIKTKVVDTVFNALLHEPEGATEKTLTDGRTWNTGGHLSLAQAVSLFDGELLKHLKNECGGLQTLLRNHYHIFRVQGGSVYIRDMGPADEAHWSRKKKQKGNDKSDVSWRKTRLCYLHGQHPDGCPRPSSECRFAHGEDELRSRSTLTI